MGNEWANKSSDEIMDDLKAMMAQTQARPMLLDQLDTIGLAIPLGQWERVMWYGWRPDMPPALDMWRRDLFDAQ